MKRALITGITGQDGSYLTEFFINKGYEVHGIKRRASLINNERIDHLYQDVHAEHKKLYLHHGDRPDVEAQYCVQLTSTNSSIGLIYALKKIFIRYNS